MKDFSSLFFFRFLIINNKNVVMRRLLLFEIYVGQGRVLLMDHKRTFSAEKSPIEDQNGPSILAVCCSGANTASLQVVLFHRILIFFCSDLVCVLGHQFHLKMELQM